MARSRWELDEETKNKEYLPWVKTELSKITDADPDLLADYILELLKAGEGDNDIKTNILRNLDDLLKAEDAEKLIDELLRRFVPQDQLQKIPVHAPDEGIVRRWNKEEDIQALASKGTRAGPHPLPARITAENEPHSSKIRSRKRSRIDQDEDIVQPSGDYQYGGTASGSKRRAQRVDTTNNLGGSRLQTIQGPVNLNTSALQNGFMPNINPVHMPPTQNFGGFEQRFYPPQAYGDMTQMLPTVPSLNGMFNRQTAMETMRAIQEMRDMVGLMQSMMPQPATTSSGQKNNRGQHESQLCLDFATKGFCPAGPSCPYSHGNTLTVPLGPGAQDPSVPASASETLQSSSLTLSHPGAKSSRKSQQPRQPVFASRYPGRYAGAYNATIVIQRIPEEHCSKEEVREFCSQFGNVVEVVVHASDRLAIVRFDDMDSAHNVFRSSEPIFNNRFVSVSWYRPDLLPEEQSYEAAVNGTHLQMTKPWDNLTFNMEEALEKIARDQKKFEERKAKIETAKRLDANYEERLRMRAEIRAKGEDLPEDPELLEVLKKKLANLEEQGAEIDRRDSARFNHSGYHYHSYYPRARYSHRGGAFSGVNRLDNRPRSVSLTLADPADPSADQTIEEAQQEILIAYPNGEAAVEPHPAQAKALVVAFKERFMAEVFVDSRVSNPLLQKFAFAWYKPEATTAVATVPPDGAGVPALSETVVSDDDGLREEPRDLDVADEDDDIWRS